MSLAGCSHLLRSRNGDFFPRFLARKNKALAAPWFHKAAEPKEGAQTEPWDSWNVTVGTCLSPGELCVPVTAPAPISSSFPPQLCCWSPSAPKFQGSAPWEFKWMESGDILGAEPFLSHCRLEIKILTSIESTEKLLFTKNTWISTLE